ncbi:MAG: hypothetical protein M1829_003809 [Trizodia sp. TS-e1964]|nr:MAG: hypothetical protein M1829_003809 [Trizodia sp. TS-e1964]
MINSDLGFKMIIDDMISDAYLKSVLEIATLTRDQCIGLIDYAEANPYALAEDPSVDTQLHLSREQRVLHTYLAQLRGLNRNALLRVRATKQATAEARQEVDRLHLQLQNLYYEQRHLLGEISACESYDHKYQQLPLTPVEEFLRNHPELANENESDLMTARINHEHAEREQLEQTRQGLLKKKQGLIADNKKRKEDLANLDKDLEKFIDAAKPIQKTFEKEY